MMYTNEFSAGDENTFIAGDERSLINARALYLASDRYCKYTSIKKTKLYWEVVLETLFYGSEITPRLLAHRFLIHVYMGNSTHDNTHRARCIKNYY